MSERRDRSFNENLDKVRKLAPEQRTPELLIGRSVVEVISVLPTFCWHMEDGAYRFGKLGISELRAINYRTFRKDCFEPSSAIPTIPGLPLEMERLSPLLSSPENWTAALISLVGLDEYRKGMENDSAHIPLIDIDSDLPLDKLVPLVREEMKKTEISDGVILASSDPRTGNINRERGHIHVIGIKRLLTQDQLRIFLAASMFMKDPQGKMLVDPTWIRIALFPKMHAVGQGSQIPERRRLPGSIYDWEYREMFTVLRVSASKKKSYFPRVIDVL